MVLKEQLFDILENNEPEVVYTKLIAFLEKNTLPENLMKQLFFLLNPEYGRRK